MAEVYIKQVPIALGGDALKPALMSRPAPTRAEIAHWEAANGRLPEDYIAFMMAHNGGTVYPANFLHNTDDPTEFLEIGPETGIDSLFTWDRFVEVNGFPPVDWRHDHVTIGYDYSSSRILLSRRQQDFGAVRYWWRNISDWDEDEDGPIPVGTVAASFRDFIFTALYASADSGTPRWYIPADLATAAKVSF
jgi:hypothetical protein